jgi:adenylate cyclase
MRHLAAPDGLQHALLAACYAQMSDVERARMHTAEVSKRIPGFATHEHCLPTLHYKREADLAHHLDALRKAGLPE